MLNEIVWAAEKGVQTFLVAIYASELVDILEMTTTKTFFKFAWGSRRTW